MTPFELSLIERELVVIMIIFAAAIAGFFELVARSQP